MMYNSTELMAILVNGMDAISKLKEAKEINESIETLLSELSASEKALLLVRDKEKNRLLSRCRSRHHYDIDTTEGLLGFTLSQNKPMFFNHIRSEKYYDEAVDNPSDMKLKAQLIYPIKQDGNILGLLRVSRSIKVSKNYTQNDISLFQSIEPYLIKMIHLLSNDQKNVQVDASSVSQKIEKLEKNTKEVNSEVNDTMLFLSNTVHDIRTPANSLYGFLDLMEEQIEDKKLLKFIQNAKQSAEFINTLTDTILERVKYENEVRTSEPEKVNSINFFSGIANIFSANMTSKGIHYLVKIDPTMPKEIEIETVKLKRVLINLIGNAYKFTPAGRVIELAVSYHEKRVKIAVKDTGLGIEESRQKEIFKAFEQAKEDTSIHYGGTGLGLAICSKYVADLGGDLKLESEPEKGSNFFFEIPVVAEKAEQSCVPLNNCDHVITIYTDDENCIDANYMKSYIEKCGIPSDNIVISPKVRKTTTHLICFEHKLNKNVIDVAVKHEMKLVLFEEKLFSLSKQEKYKAYTILSKNNYYTDLLYSAISPKAKPNILIVDDNKLNVQLLESILESEYCDVTARYNGEDGFQTLKGGLEKGAPFDIIFSDKHMDGLSGTEMLKQYRTMELAYPGLKKIYAVSITGDIELAEEERKLYDKVIHKPFKRDDVLNVLSHPPA